METHETAVTPLQQRYLKNTGSITCLWLSAVFLDFC